jgi:hypothetical protein
MQALLLSFMQEFVSMQVLPDFGLFTRNGGDFDPLSVAAGTKFMASFTSAFSFYLQEKIAKDPAWSHLSVFFSGTFLNHPQLKAIVIRKIMTDCRQESDQIGRCLYCPVGV